MNSIYNDRHIGTEEALHGVTGNCVYVYFQIEYIMLLVSHFTAQKNCLDI